MVSRATGEPKQQTWMDYLAEAGKLIGKEPGNQRTVLKGVAAVIDGLSLLHIQGSKALALLGTAKTADKTLKVFKGASKIHDWYHYHYKGWLTFIRDMADTVVVGFALPQLLNEIGVISFAAIGESLGKVPILGHVTAIPLSGFISGLEILVSIIMIYQSTKKIFYACGSHNNTKLEAWQKRQSRIAEHPVEGRNEIRKLIEKKHTTLFKKVHLDAACKSEAGFFFKTVVKHLDDEKVDKFVQDEIDKWDKRVNKHKQSLIIMEIVNIIFHLVIITLSVLVILSAVFAIAGLGLAITLLGITAAAIGIGVLIHDCFNPRDQWSKPIQITDLT